MNFTWSDSSALWELEHGEDNTDRKASARSYLEGRLDDYTPEELNAARGHFTRGDEPAAMTDR